MVAARLPGIQNFSMIDERHEKVNYFFSGLPGSPGEWERKTFPGIAEAIEHAEAIGWVFVHAEIEDELSEVWCMLDRVAIS